MDCDDAEEEKKWNEADVSIHSALNGPEAKEWWAAMCEEVESLEEQGTWEKVFAPKVGVKWVLVKKVSSDGGTIRFKARLVATGFFQRYGLDCEEMYAPVGGYTTARVLLSIAAAMDLELIQVDGRQADHIDAGTGNVETPFFKGEPPAWRP